MTRIPYILIGIILASILNCGIQDAFASDSKSSSVEKRDYHSIQIQTDSGTWEVFVMGTSEDMQLMAADGIGITTYCAEESESVLDDYSCKDLTEDEDTTDTSKSNESGNKETKKQSKSTMAEDFSMVKPGFYDKTDYTPVPRT